MWTTWQKFGVLCLSSAMESEQRLKAGFTLYTRHSVGQELTADARNGAVRSLSVFLVALSSVVCFPILLITMCHYLQIQLLFFQWETYDLIIGYIYFIFFPTNRERTFQIIMRTSNTLDYVWNFVFILL